jgi:hypothetical protein
MYKVLVIVYISNVLINLVIIKRVVPQPESADARIESIELEGAVIWRGTEFMTEEP